MALRSYCRLLAAQVACLKHCVNDCTRNVSGSSLSFARIKSLRGSAGVFVLSSRWHRRSWHPGVSSSQCTREKLHSDTAGFSRWTLAWGVMAFSLFGSSDERTEEQKLEDELILLLKKAKYSMMTGELDAANVFLHKAVRLAHQMHSNDAIIYTYSLMANLAFVQGQLENAEKLFKAAMSFMLSGGTPQDDNAVIEMSLKLASIYATQSKNELAEHGFQFCTESLEAKIEKQKDLLPESLTDEERKDTRLLLGLSLDARARYLAANRRFTGSCRDYRHALQICQEEQGESHPQTLVLMSDLATVLDLQGKHDEALAHAKKAVELAQAAGHPDQHVLLGNMAGILMHKGEFEESGKLYQEALALARAAGDEEAVEQLQEGLKELTNRRDGQTESKADEQEIKQ
ncbi:tetratricopeptide repeat protein 19, mitochondrial [Rhinichthys klamathensis goyatoka]|uniref:tetratricopeptide repeat protein 19, mitochondrial n=1 Tax=Rhinichthys klamathensis goyatoka TaxID=3034132 RepID=UPI0024B63409|nr:tetratricopeptide repeat protein 19, mitochondrial [Rhinichthys klamathensis goyatoka]